MGKKSREKRLSKINTEGKKVKNKKNQEVCSSRNIYLDWILPLTLASAISIVPLICYLKLIPLEGAAFDYWTGAKVHADFFNYWKSVWLQVITGLGILIFFLTHWLTKTGITPLKKSPFYFPLALYALLAIFSTLFSEYKNIAIWGFTDRYEGLLVILSYILLTIIAINTVRREIHLKIIFGFLFTSIFIVSIIGFFQYVGYDFFQTVFGRNLLLPAEYKYLADSLVFSFGPRTIYGTFYNTNYTGSYMVMAFFLSITMLLLLSNSFKNKRTVLYLKMALLFFSLITLINLIGSNSRTGITGALITLILFLIVFQRPLIKKWHWLLVASLLLIIISTGLNFISEGRVTKELENLKTDIQLIFSENQQIKTKKDIDITMDDKITTIYLKDFPPLIITTENNSFIFKDNNYNKLAYFLEDKTILFNNETYNNYGLSLPAENKITLKSGKNDITFKISENEIFLLNYKNEEVRIKPVESFATENFNLFGSGRGYIWSRSIPIIKNTLLLGYGPDSFIFYFPHDDYLGRLNTNFSQNEFIDKPHSFYLQLAINTGVPSLLAVIALLGMYFVSSFKIYFRKKDFSSLFSVAGAAIFMATFAYAVSMIANDSVVSVAPLFWGLLGIGISCNMIVKSNSEESA